MEIEEAWKFVLSEIHEKVRKHVPVLRYRKRNHKMPWWSNKLKKEVQKKHKMWNVYTNCATPDNFARYKQQRNLTTGKIRKARCNYESKIVASMKEDPKKLHAYIRSQQRVKATVGPLEKEDGSLTQTDHEVAESLQRFFLQVQGVADKSDA